MEINMSVIPGKKPGIAGKINVKIDEHVEEGTVLAQIETAKGNRVIKASKAGVIEKIHFNEGDEITSKQLLFELKEDEVEETVNECSEEKTKIKKESELLIIGGGPGGYVAAIYAAKKGLKVTLVEKRELGGTCLIEGCIPTKAFVKSAELYHEITKANDFGIVINDNPQPDMKKIVARKNEIKNQLVQGIHGLMDKNNIEIIKGTACFSSENTVLVEGDESFEITAKDIIIATGSKTSKINIPGIDLPVVMDSTKALDNEQLPSSITIIGGGVIGMEFAFIYNALGVQVHVVEFMDRLLYVLDKDAGEEIEKEAQLAGIHIHTGSRVNQIKQSVDGKAVILYEGKEKEEIITSDKVLVAIGREPNLDGLQIEKAGIKTNENKKGIAVDSQMKTNKEHIYAIGDVTNIIQLAHVASHQGIVAVNNICHESCEMDYRVVPNVVFTAPEIASVGYNEQECKQQNIDYKTSYFNFEGNGKALTLGKPNGFVKLIADGQGEYLLGAIIIGADASSLIATLTLAIKNKVSVNQITETIFAHPTTAETIHEAALDLGIGALHQ